MASKKTRSTGTHTRRTAGPVRPVATKKRARAAQAKKPAQLARSAKKAPKPSTTRATKSTPRATPKKRAPAPPPAKKRAARPLAKKSAPPKPVPKKPAPKKPAPKKPAPKPPAPAPARKSKWSKASPPPKPATRPKPAQRPARKPSPAQLKKLRSASARKGWQTRNARERARRAGAHKTGERRRIEPAELQPVQTGGSATAFPEQRWYANGNQLLGYLEGRPGITRITTLEPWKMKEREEGARRPRLDADTRSRIESLPMVMEAGEDEREGMIDSVIEAWREAEDGGALVEVEIEYESNAT